MKIAMLVFFGTTSVIGAGLTALFIIGLWAMLQKSGVPGWWALIPCARDYQMARCAEREPEGRITCLTSLAILVIQLLLQFELLSIPAAEESEISIDLLVILIFALHLVKLIYSIRVCAGLIEVYGRRRRWLWLWIPFSFLPALIWGFSGRFQPLWKVEDIRRELSDVTSSGMANILDDGLTVNLRIRKVREFLHMKTLIRDIHLSIPPGRMVLLLGGSGAGKTVFVNAICGYEKADASVLLGGTDIYKHYKKMQYQIGYAPQQDTMRGKDTIYGTLMDTAKLRLPKDALPSERKARVDKVLDIFGLTPSRTHLVEKLSGGQRKRVSIAMELLSNPALFILDEPDSGLDGVMARELMEQLRAVADQGKIVIVITHTPDRVVDLFDDVIVLAKDDRRVGRLAFYGSVEEARAFFGRDRMEDIVKTINMKAVGGEGRAEEFIAKYAEVQHA
jgi:ABC-type multidrug transport system ATPase subunit